MRWLICLLLILGGCTSPQQPGFEIDNPQRYIGCFAVADGFSVVTARHAITIGEGGMQRAASYLTDKHGPFILVKPPFHLKQVGSKFLAETALGEGTLIRIVDDQAGVSITIVDTVGRNHSATKQRC